MQSSHKQGAVSQIKPVKEEILLEMISDVYNNLAQSNKSILHKYLKLMRKRLTKQKELKKNDNIQHEITVLEQKRDKLLDYNMGGYISDAEFFKQKQGFYTADSREKVIWNN